MFGIRGRVRAVVWSGVWSFVGALVLMPVGASAAAPAKEDEAAVETKARPNFGREARAGTPIINRDANAPLTDREKIFHVLSRFSIGPTPGMVDVVEKQGLDAWFEEQLKARQDEPRTLQGQLDALESLTLTNQQILQKYNPPIPPELSNLARLTPEQRRERARLMALREVPRRELKDAVLLLAIDSPNRVKETASDFWRNHFNVDVSKGQVRYYATTYERDVIRYDALGTFSSMLNRQARHPAMLVFLDNFISRAIPNKELMEAARKAYVESRDYGTALEAIDIAKQKGLNENYGREIMELHTLGVDNYYTQEDVIAVSEALTGWTVQQNPKYPIEFVFKPEMHAFGARTVLNVKFPANARNGEAEGQAVLDMLVKHPGTANYIAYKLCRHFVNDRPSPDMVERVAKAFRSKNKTDLKDTYRAILNDPEFFEPANYQTKFKRPFEFVVSAVRATGAEVVSAKGLQRAMLALNEPLYQCEDPTGYYDQADVWRDPGTMAGRWQFGIGLAMGHIAGVNMPDSIWDGLEENNPLQWKKVLSKRILPLGHTQQTDAALDEVIARYSRYNPEAHQLGRYIVGLLLGSPEFQRQ